MKLKYLEQPECIPIGYLPNYPGQRTFRVLEDIEVELSNGQVIIIQKGFLTDLASIPKWGWSILRPFDMALMGDIIHDWLWKNKKELLQNFNTIYELEKFSDNERELWRLALAKPLNLRLKTYFTAWFIRNFGREYYTGEKGIPN